MAAVWLASGGKLGFGVKPPTPTLNPAHPLAQGLVFDANYWAPGGAGNIERAGRTPISTYTGTTTSIGPHGVARTFPGGAATDRDVYVSNAAVNSLVNVSIEFLFKPNGAGGNNAGRILRKGGAGGRLNVEYDDTTPWIGFSGIWGTTDGDWNTPNGSIVSGAWNHVVIAYSFSSTSNVPTIYINGVPQTLTTNLTPAGSAPTDSTSLIIGNREDNARCINANISHLRIWNRMLSQGEAIALYADPFQVYQRPGPAPYALPSEDTTLALTGVAATGARGTLSPAIDAALAGFAATGAIGTLTPSLATLVDLTGLSATGSAGSLSPSLSVALTGVAATGSRGSLTATFSLGLAGLSATGSSGSLAAAISRGLTGLSATGSRGTLTPVAPGATVSLSGFSATGSVGAFGLSVGGSIAITGVSATAYAGTLTADDGQFWHAISPTLATWSALSPTSETWVPNAPSTTTWN